VRINPDLIRNIRETVTMDDVVMRLGLGPVPRDRKIRSIYNTAEKTPSLHLYRHDFYDYSTGRGGDQITFVRDAANMSFGRAVRFLANAADTLTIRKPEEREKELPDLTDRFNAAPEGGTEAYRAAYEMFEERWPHLDLDGVMHVFGVKVTPTELWIPHWDRQNPSVVRGIKIRRLANGAKLSVKGSAYTSSLYADPTFLSPGGKEGRDAILAEGESDTWSLTFLGIPAVDVYGLPSGAGMWRDEFFYQLRPYRRVYLALDSQKPNGDPDPAGLAALGSLSQKVKHDDNEVTVLEVPGGRVAEAVRDGWQPELR